MKLISDYLQLLLLALAVATQIIVLLNERRKSEKSQPSTSAAFIPPPRDLLDFSFVLMFASLVSFLLIHSLLISGRIVSLGIGLVFQATALALLIGSLLYFAYLRGKAVLAVGVLSSATLLVLLSAPGGPFRELQQGAEAAPDLLWPTVVLLTISSATLFHEFGGPFARGSRQWGRIAAIAGAACIAVIASLALGIQSTAKLDEDISIPKLTDTSKALLTAIRNPIVQPESRKLIYQLLSDYYLAPHYEELFESIRREHAGTEGEPSLALPALGLDAATWDRLSKRMSATRRKDYVAAIREAFERLNILDQTAFMQARLSYVHPLGEFNNRRAPTSVPGRGVLERYQKNSKLRQVFAISRRGSSFFSPDSSNGFIYDSDILNHFIGLPQADGKTKLPSRLPGYSPSLFPRIVTNLSYSNILERQLILPTTEEAYLAYSEYQDLAKEYIRLHLPSGLEATDSSRLSLDISLLPLDATRAYIYYNALNQRLGYSEADMIHMLVEFSDLDFAPIRGDANFLSVESLVLPRAPAQPELAALYQSLSPKSQRSQSLFKQLVSKRDLKVRLDALVDPALLNVIKRIDDKGFGSISLAQFLSNPVMLGLEDLLSRSHLEDNVKDLVRRTWVLDHGDLESVLFYLSMSLYEGGGEFAPGLFQTLILEAGLMGVIVELIVSSLLYLPVLLICIAGGDFAARKLAAREMLHRMMKSETEEAAEASSLAAKAVELVGREPVFHVLLKLARRGWSTIALAGRRGVGKSRILQKVENSYTEAGSIAVWMFAPSQFAEGDFVEDVFERLATSTEAAIGRTVGAKPLIVRGLEHRSSRLGAGVFFATLVAFSLLVLSMSERLIRPELAMSWIPSGLLIIAGICALVLHFRKLQPADLTSWIERERKIDSQLVWLYRETAEALRFVAERRVSGLPSVQFWRERSSPWLAFLFGGLGFFSFFIGAVVLFSDDYKAGDDAWQVVFWVALGGVFLAALMASFGRKKVQGSGAVGASVMLLVEKYRQYASTVVKRLRRGALGQPGEFAGVAVCIDELDKIVDFDELRRLIRTIKAIFEIPGVSYYLSISEDALAALNLGASLGKNEVDSSFDHIVMVPPLELDAGELLAARYAGFLGINHLRPRVARAVAAISFGIPRDIVRRCDELADILGHAAPEEVVQVWLNVQLDLGQSAGFLSATAANSLRNESNDRVHLVRQEFDRNDIESSVLRHLVLIGTLILLAEMAQADDETWHTGALALSTFGYGLPTRPIAELRSDFEKLTSGRKSCRSVGNP